MVRFNIRAFAYAILGLAFGTYFLLFLFTQNLESIDFRKALTHVSTTISINIIIWVLFILWAWKLRIFYPWLVPYPNLSGKWKGNLVSNWEGAEDPITAKISITQTFFNVQVKLKTEESRSHCFGASFNIDKDRGLQQLVYSYINTPKSSVRNRSEIHYGTTLLEFDGFKVSEMNGEYWTDRETTGEISLKKV